MAPKKLKGDQKPLRKVQRVSIAAKKEIVDKHERGIRVRDLMREYGLASSTICTFVKDKDRLMTADVAEGRKSVTANKRAPLLEKVEQLLMVWIKDMQLKGDTITETAICEKAKKLYSDLKQETPSTSDDMEEEFKASRGWFFNFRKRSGIHSVVRHGEAASANTADAKKFVDEFSDFVNSEEYLPQQCFNCDETGLFWKKMPNRTYITQEEKKLPGHKPMKDRLTLLFCANASGDCKIKPMLVYHSETPRAFQKNKVMKATLPVLWRANTKAWVTRLLFTDWMTHVFGPAVKKYLVENQLPLKCLLLLDNAPAHPPDLEAELPTSLDFIKIKFLPPNTTPLLQPMDQQVISNFKKLYTKFLFAKCFQVTSDTNLTLKCFWKEHFNIFHCIQLIAKAWNEVSIRTLQSAWRKLWPGCLPPRDFAGFDEDPDDPAEAAAKDEEDKLVNEVVELGQQMGLEVEAEDVEQLVEDHNEELTTEELVQLKNEQVKIIENRFSSSEDEETTPLITAEVREACRKWAELQEFFEKHHPNKSVCCRGLDYMNDNVLPYFRKVIEKKKKQSTINQFFQPISMQEKKEAAEQTPEVESSMEDSTSHQ